MKFTWNWLKDHLDTDKSLDEICLALTAIGLEVEGVDNKVELLRSFRIAKVLEAIPHPNADKLRYLQVSDGQKTYSVVCGAPNARAGLVGVLALPGDFIPGTGITLGVGEIRGVKSEGMLCSFRELTLSDEHDGIIELDESAPIGGSYAQYAGYDDAIIEIKLTPNRGDCLGVRGIARDLEAAGMGKLKPLAVPKIKESFDSPIQWKIETNALSAVPYVSGRSFRGLKNGQSSPKIRQRLLAVGCRPISQLVDITNYLTFDLGRPLHVFDGKKLKGKEITMRFAHDGENFLALDGRNYDFTPKMLVIADEKNVVSLAGVMGGEESGCDEETTDVFLEVAYFNPIDVAKTGRALQLQSDARYRFERGIDPESVEWGLEIASQMILNECGGEASHASFAGKLPQKRADISFHPDRVKSQAGVEIEKQTSKTILEKLGFGVDDSNPDWRVSPPSWRSDIEGRHCLVEEILRIHGFDTIPQTTLPRPHFLAKPAINEHWRRASMARRALVAMGFYEAVSFSFCHENMAELLKDQGKYGKALDRVQLQNPIASHLSTMRPSVLANLLTALKENHNRGAGLVQLFEVGTAYRGAKPEQQIPMIAGLEWGTAPDHWQVKSLTADVYSAKAAILKALEAMNAPIANLQLKTDGLPDYYHPGRSGALVMGNQALGFFGELHPAVNDYLDLRGRIVAFEIFYQQIPLPKMGKARTKPLYKESELMAITRDFAFVVQGDIKAEQICKAALKADKDLIVDAHVFDSYSDESLLGKKSYALRVKLQPKDKSFNEAEIQVLMEKIIGEVIAATGGNLR